MVRFNRLSETVEVQNVANLFKIIQYNSVTTG